MYPEFAGELLHPQGVFQINCQRLFNHHMDTSRGTGLDNLHMLCYRSECHNCPGLHLIKHLIEIIKEKRPVKGIFLSVLFNKAVVGLVNPDKIQVRAVFLKPVEYKPNMVVAHPGDGDLHR